MVPTTAGIRKLLTELFSDEELTILCFDYFRDVHDDFALGLSKGQKIQRLIECCNHREAIPNLLAAMVAERAAQYDARFGAPVEAVVPAAEQPRSGRDPRKVFISHAYEDTDFAHRLAADLQTRGWRIWIAPDSILPGEKWVEAINRGLEESGVFVVALTPAAVESSWVKFETDIAIEQAVGEELHFIPLGLQACRPPLMWNAYQRVPFDERYEEGLRQLLGRLEMSQADASIPPGRMPGPTTKTPELSHTSAPSRATLIAESFTSPSVPENRLPFVGQEDAYTRRVLWPDDDVVRYCKHGHFSLRDSWEAYGRCPFYDCEGKRYWTRNDPQFFEPMLGALAPSASAGAPGHSVASAELKKRQAPTPLPTQALPVLIIESPIHLELVRVPAGEFLMGSDPTRDNDAQPWEQPQHLLSLPGFFIGKYPVTNAQYVSFLKATRQSAPKHWGRASSLQARTTTQLSMSLGMTLSRFAVVEPNDRQDVPTPDGGRIGEGCSGFRWSDLPLGRSVANGELMQLRQQDQ